MEKLLDLVALKSFADSIGHVSAGQEFRVYQRYGQSLIQTGFARLKTPSAMQKKPEARRWEGGKVVIIAGGPSLTQEDVNLVQKWRSEFTHEIRRVIVINTTYKTAPWADVLYAADLAWWKEYYEQAKEEFKGEMWTQNDAARKRFPGLHYVQCERRPGHSTIRGIIHNGGNSGYQSIELAAGEFGAAEIYLLAFDMKKTNGQSHHHGDHPKSLRQSSPFADWLRSFKKLAQEIKASGVRVVNCSRSTALHEFDEFPIDEVLNVKNEE